MNKYNIYEHPTAEPDEREREKMTFCNPFQDPVIEGVSAAQDKELKSVVILSSN